MNRDWSKFERMPKVLNEEFLSDLCDRHKEEIGSGNCNVRPCPRIRYVIDTDRFGYADFGDFFFWADGGLYVWHEEDEYEEDHDPYAVEDYFGGSCERRGYVCRHIFAGIDTGYDDSDGSRMFTGDIVLVKYPDGDELGALCLASLCDRDGDGFYGFPLDNHSLTLDMCKEDGYNLERIGTIFYQLDNRDVPEPIWNKALGYNYAQRDEKREKTARTMAKYTPNFYQETWKYLGYEILGVEEFNWKNDKQINDMKKEWITTIQALLEGRNEEFDKADKKRVKLLRHKDKGEKKIIDGKEYKDSLYDLYLNEHEVFLCYQSEQLVKNFKNVDYIVSFIGEESTTSRFVGVFRNNGILKRLEDYKDEEVAKFDFVELEGFDLLKERVVINWNSPLAWRQNYTNEMPVVRIDRGLWDNNIPDFTRFEDVVLDYNQLKLIFDTNNQEWRSKLESCNGIYLILDKSNGKQYVGSTYNSDGIWGRWEQYAKTGHGGDKDLKPLLENDPAYAKKYFQWCILETLPLKILEEHAIDRESLYKRKFGTREHDNYNNN